MIWVFAEERSGSTWLCEVLARRLGKGFVYLEQYDPRDGHIHQTHNFELLSKVSGPLIRTTRRDLLEHFLSVAILHKAKDVDVGWWNLPHIYQEVREFHLGMFHRVVANIAVTVTKDDVVRYLTQRRERDRLWSRYGGDNQTVCYEDLVDGVHLNVLGEPVSFRSSDVLMKLPYDKRALVSNWQEAETWLKELS
jgi:hypothetical protein